MNSTYGFDYFVSRQKVLTEMARPSPLTSMGPHGELVKSFLDTIGRVMAKGGEVNGLNVTGMGGNRHVNRMLRYFIFLMTKMDEEVSDEGEVSDEEAQTEIVGAATHILGIPREGWRKRVATADALYRAAILKGINGEYKEYVTSPEFREKVLDPSNILSYVSTNRITDSFSHSMAAKREEIHGMSAEDIDAAQTGLKDLVVKINRAEAARKRKKNLEILEEPKSEDQVTNDYTVNLDIIKISLKLLIKKCSAVKQVVNTTLNKYNNPDEDTINDIIEDIASKYHENVGVINTLFRANVPTLEMLLATYSKLEDVGIDMPKFYNSMNKIKTAYASDQNIVNLIDMLTYTVSEFLEKMIQTDNPKSNTQEFSGYSNDIINAFLKTPEEKEQFRKYHNWLKVERERRIAKVEEQLNSLKWGENEVPGEAEIVRKGFEQFMAKRPEMKQQQFADQNDISKSLGKAQRNESYVMGYMTEQVSKDRFKPNGEFKDRGFKKPINYAHWLMINE